MRVRELSHPITAAPPDGAMVLVELPAAYIPYAILGLEPYKLRFLWATPEDYAIGYEAICDFQIRLLTDMTQPIVDAIDRVYMAVRQGFTGEVFTATGEGLPPVLPVVPPVLPADFPGGLLGLVQAMRGVINPGWFGIGGEYATLADVVTALRAGSEDEVDRVVGVLELLQGASSSATIFDAVKDFFVQGAELTTEGLMLATMIAASMAQSAQMGLQAGQLDQLKAELVAISGKLAATVPALPEDTVAGAVAGVRDLLTPDEYEAPEV